MLSPLLQRKAFHSLWCQEESYSQIELDLQKIDISSYSKPELGLRLYCSENLSFVTTLAGNRTSIGAIQAKEVEIRAFGPQAAPLSDSIGFGIYRLPDGNAIDRWTAFAANPEIWLDLETCLKENQLFLNGRLLGMKSESQYYFVFYIKAAEASIAEAVHKPKSLIRYRGETVPALFDRQIEIKTNVSSKMELIPLAGGGCFWDSDFLLAYELIPENEFFFFQISVLI